MKPITDRLEEIRTNGYQLDFGNVFEHAFENYKKIALYAGLMILVFSILIIAIAFGAAISVFGATDLTKWITPENLNPEKFSNEFLVIYIVGGALFNGVLSPFYAGFLKMADSGEKGLEFNVSTMFEYYKLPYFKEILIATFLTTLAGSSISTLLDLVDFKIIGLILLYTIEFSMLFSVPLIIFGNLKASEAIKQSILIVFKKPFILLGLIIVAFIVSMLGFFGFCIGIFFTLPFIYSMKYAIYTEILGIDSESELDEIGTVQE